MVKEEGVRAAPIRIDPRGLKGAMDGDRVQVRLERARKRARAEGVREGVVVRILERRLEEVVGRWIDDRGRPFLRPLDRRLRFVLVPTSSRLDREPDHGDFVVASLDGVSARGNQARGVLLERLGRLGDPGIEDRVVLRMYGIPEHFPEDVLAEAEALPEVISEEEIGQAVGSARPACHHHRSGGRARLRRRGERELGAEAATSWWRSISPTCRHFVRPGHGAG